MLRLQRISSYLAVGVSGVIVFTPLAYRLSVVPLGVAFVLFAVGVGLGLVSALVIGVSLIRNGVDSSKSFATIALCIVGCVVAIPLMSILSAVGVPAIHDITTDMLDPPQFVEAVKHVTPGRTLYGGDELANQQREAYPDIVPIIVAETPDVAFSFALVVAREIGWENIVITPGEQRIEATDRTRWFGFVDDIVIRIRPEERGSRVDVRSLSRVGVGDLGANAARIRRFRDALNSR